MSSVSPGPVVFAYDGSELAKHAIDEAGLQLRPQREAIVLTIWQTFTVGFALAADIHIDASRAPQVKRLAQETADDGASRAERAGFRARGMAAESSPVWKGIADVADASDASLIVLGSHGRSGFPGALLGSVAQAVAAHSKRSVMIVHGRPTSQAGPSEL